LNGDRVIRFSQVKRKGLYLYSLQYFGMKKTFLIFAGIILLAFSGNGHLKDGQFNGVSRAVYIEEPFYGMTRILIEKGRIVKVEFTVRDSSTHEIFDGEYEKHFAGNYLYVQQCRNDWKGIRSYPDSLLKHQDINKVDAISGATWSYNIFRASAKEALKQAKKRADK
jgi:major membrane immunogen (membrane-anchored lipoprotein)